MSEYQYYEFRAIDRPLAEEEMAELRKLSTRAEITPTGLTNTYHWGDFKGDPKTLIDRYFDAFVYVANWGTHRLMFRIPAGLLDAGQAEAYCDDEALSIEARKGHVVIEFQSEDEDGEHEWIEEEEWMPSLIMIRGELMRGDLRALYLGWLASLRSRGWEDQEYEDGEGDGIDAHEPPVPPGLAKLSAPLKSLADFLRVEDALIEAASALSIGEPAEGPSRAELARWIGKLPAADKDAYLVRFLAEEGDLALRAELSRRFREATATRGARPAPEAGRRTIAELLAARDAVAAEKARKAAERAAVERARLEREQATARVKHLDALARRQVGAWGEVQTLIATKRPKEYDRALELLVDLVEIAGRSGRAAEAAARIVALRREHAGKPSLIRRLDDRKLGE